MKRRMVFLFSVCMLCLIFPIRANAVGGYYVIRGEREYHSVFCDKLEGKYIEDFLWYKTDESAKRAGFKQAKCCIDLGFDYTDDGDTTFQSRSEKTQNALEIERFYGVFDTYEEMKDEIYDEGYNAGYDSGHDRGFEDGKIAANKEYQKSNNHGKESNATIYFIGMVCFAIIGFFCGKIYKKESMEAEIRILKRENEFLEKRVKDYIQQHDYSL